MLSPPSFPSFSSILPTPPFLPHFIRHTPYEYLAYRIRSTHLIPATLLCLLAPTTRVALSDLLRQLYAQRVHHDLSMTPPSIYARLLSLSDSHLRQHSSRLAPPSARHIHVPPFLLYLSYPLPRDYPATHKSLSYHQPLASDSLLTSSPTRMFTSNLPLPRLLTALPHLFSISNLPPIRDTTTSCPCHCHFPVLFHLDSLPYFLRAHCRGPAQSCFRGFAPSFLHCRALSPANHAVPSNAHVSSVSHQTAGCTSTASPLPASPFPSSCSISHLCTSRSFPGAFCRPICHSTFGEACPLPLGGRL